MRRTRRVIVVVIVKEVSMSQYSLGHKVNGEQRYFIYGFDEGIPEYFLTDITDGDDPQCIVGMLGGVYGDRMNLHEKMNELGLWKMLTDDQRSRILMDLPF
jgi:hypothetical protein